MATRFTIYDSNNLSVDFSYTEATDSGTTKPYYTLARGAQESAGGNIKQQIRHGKRFNKLFLLCISETKYLSLVNLLTNQADDYYIEFTTPPSLLLNDGYILEDNNLKISVSIGDVELTADSGSGDIVYRLNLFIQSAALI